MDDTFDGNKNELIVRKESALININNDDITLSQRKFMNICLYVAKEEINKNPDAHVFVISFKKLRDLSGIKTTDLKRIREEFEELQDKKVKYNVTRKGRNNWGRFPYIGGINFEEYDKKARETGQVLITFDLPHQILESIRNPNVYAYIDLLIVKGLKSKYSIALYEIARDYYKIKTKIFTVVEVRELLGVGDKYTLFNMFEKRVLKLAVNEVSEKTEFFVEYVVIRTGKKKDKIKFTFNKREQDALILEGEIVKSSFKNEPINTPDNKKPNHKQEVPSNIDKEIYEQLLNHGITSIQVSEFINNPDIGVTGIEEGFLYYKRMLDDDKIHTNKPAYLAQAISKGWGKKTPEEIAKEKRQKEIEDARTIIKESKEILEELEKEKSAYFDEKATEIIESLVPAVKDGLEKECIAQLKDIEKDLYKNASGMFKSIKFKTFIRERFVDDTDEEVLGEISRKRNVDVGEVEGKIVEAQEVLKGYGVPYTNIG